MKVSSSTGRRGRRVGVLLALHSVTLSAGASLLAWPMFVTLESQFTQWSGERQLLETSLTAKEKIVETSPRLPAGKQRYPGGAVVGRFEVPRLQLSYVVLEGTQSRTLDKSIGHVEGTADIGESGNIGIAGHRNTHFRKLEWIRRGDEIKLSSKTAEFCYRVEWVRLFKPGDSEVLDPSHGPALTLVSCFPFEYVGAAPLRFVVRALPDENTRSRLQTSLSGLAVR
ncbi:MAG TPA: class D sortase [Terriglobia bacterium]|jgi:LPXTG-site transpeptidase (sortase) family protein|nr:class D sortase [Terriglobia bacterium]